MTLSAEAVNGEASTTSSKEKESSKDDSNKKMIITQIQTVTNKVNKNLLYF